jgi:hypothetical protein
MMFFQITNITVMQLQREMFDYQIDQEIEELSKEVVQSFPLSSKDERLAIDILESKGKVI